MKNVSVSKNGVMVCVNRTWYGVRWFWQSYPLFGLINMHRKCDTVHHYGVIVFGFNVFWYIDE